MNLIIWDYRKLFHIRAKHLKGSIREARYELGHAVKGYLAAGTQEDSSLLRAAKAKVIGKDQEETVEKVYATLRGRLSQKTIEAGFEPARPDEDGDPRTVWGMVQGLTRYSQHSNESYTDKRVLIDVEAGKLLKLAA